jgi:tRNA threonylcarbamoyl adenosine modification protein YjeE
VTIGTIALADADATARAGQILARHVRGGDAVALVGELGAGKTALVSGLVAGLGAGTAVSPTFALINEYHGRLIVWHVDLYRLDRASELVELGLDDLFGDRRGLVVVEWADRFDVMPSDHLRLELGHVTIGRTLDIAGTGPRGRELASALSDELLGSTA